MEVVGRSMSADMQELVVYAQGIRAGLQKSGIRLLCFFFNLFIFVGGKRKNPGQPVEQ